MLAAFVKAGLVTSNGEARRQIKGGGLRVNDATVTDEKMALTQSQLTPEGVIKLSLGKKAPRAAEAGLAIRMIPKSGNRFSDSDHAQRSD